MEKKRPYDLEVRVKNGNVVKRFGIQIKRPHVDRRGLYWGLNRRQHSTMRGFPWIYYAFPTFVDPVLQRVACHHVLIVPRHITYRPQIREGSLGRRYRWGGFAEAIVKCTAGQRLDPQLASTSLASLVRELRLRNSILADVDLSQRIVEIFATEADQGEEPVPEE